MGILNKILFGLVVTYIVNSIYTFYQIFFYENCEDKKYCINPLIKPNVEGIWPLLQLRVYLGAENSHQKDDIILVYRKKDVDLKIPFEDQINYKIPVMLAKNGSLKAYIVLVENSFEGDDLKKASWQASDADLLSRYDTPKDKTFSLVGEEMINIQKNTSIPHFSTVIPISFVIDDIIFDERRIPEETRNRIPILKKDGRLSYAPIITIDSMRIRIADEVEVDSQLTAVNLTINYKPISWGRYRLGLHMEMSFRQLQEMGFGVKDFDDMKAIFNEMNFPFLVMMVSVAAIHLLFDFLTFKNDVQFWQKRKTMVGISTKTLSWRCVSETVIFFYLMDEKSSYLILIPSGIGTVVEYWKLRRALKIEIYFKKGWIPWPKFGKLNKEEERTEALDSEGMRYLTYLIIPLCIIGAIYNLLYVPQKSWFSWVIKCLANCIYAFGFLFMLPQLFLNYKLKSVAHLPWRAFMYKAFNTFIDDVFAFIITMPTAHRLACFRDDLVFVIFLYQRYLYPVDKSRVNEFGESFEAEAKKNKKEE